MNTKHLLLAATAAAFVTLNFTSCKEDDFDLSFDNCVAKVSPVSIKYEEDFKYIDVDNIDTIYLKEVCIFGADATIKYGMDDVKGSSLTYIGTSKDKMKPLSDYAYHRVELQPFATYYIESIPYIVHNGDTVFGEKQEMKFYSIPKHELVLTADYGDGEIAANIHWKLRYYYKKEDKYVHPTPYTSELSHQYYDYEGTLSSVNVNLITNYDTTYNKDALDIPVDVDSCYITQGGTRENPDYPAYIYRYWKDGKAIMYYDPVIYDFCFNIKIPLGEEEFSVKDTIRSILMDKSSCVCDLDYNIYRTAKIGNKTWTIDNYRGRLKSSEYHYYFEPDKSVFGCDLIYFHQPGSYEIDYIPGYHMARSDDWADLESYYGIVYPENMIDLRVDSIKQQLTRCDTSLQKFFSTGGGWHNFLSSYGWQSEDGEFITNEQWSFNAVPAGYYHRGSFGEYKYAAFLSDDDGSVRLVSAHYEGIAKSNDGQFYAEVSIRYVKD